MLTLSVIFFFLGSIFGSFSSVLISRWKSGKSGIFLGRSECPKCGHTLSGSELIPLFSYLAQGGKCKQCKTRIPFFYPMAEMVMGVIFVIILWAGFKINIGIFDVSFWFLLFFGFVVGVYILYDILYMEIPLQIIFFALGVIICMYIFAGISGSKYLFFDFHTFHTYENFIKNHIFAAIILYTFIYAQILISGSIFLIRKQRYKEIFGLILFYITFFWYSFCDTIGIDTQKSKEEKDEEIETWIGAGDMMIAIFSGLTLGIVHGITSFFIAYIVGSIIGIIMIIIGIIRKKPVQSQIPFGPFLGIGWLISLLFYNEILEGISMYLYL